MIPQRKFPTPPHYRHEAITIDLVGCGGTGSRVLSELAILDLALRSTDHKHGLHVAVWDPDRVDESTVGGSTFAPSDVGQYKASVLVTRINTVYGLMWRGLGKPYQHHVRLTERGRAPAKILITCVDRLRPRVDLYQDMRDSLDAPPDLWIDAGNDRDFGQVVCGQPEWRGRRPDLKTPRLHTVVDLFPGMVEAAAAEPDEPDSCSLAQRLGRQSATINRHMSTWIAEMASQLLIGGGLDWNAVFVSAASGRANSAYRAEGAPADIREVRPGFLNGGESVLPRSRRRLRSSGPLPRRLTCR